jgi:hypothetical protein
MKRLSSVALLSFLLFACQKDLSYQNEGVVNGAVNTPSIAEASDGSAAYYVRFKSGTESESFNFNTKALLSEAGNAKSLVLQASANAENVKKESIRLYLTFLSGSPAEGTYKQGDADFKYLVSGSYNPADASVTYTAGLNPSTELPLNITITSITNGVIKGSFKGAFYKHDLTTGIMTSDYTNYSEGEFNLPIY